MAIVGIDTALFGVPDMAQTARFFEDMGLPVFRRSADEVHFRLEEGSNLIVRHADHPSVPRSVLCPGGMQEIILGVDTQQSLDALVADLGRDRDVKPGADGAHRFLSDCGIPLGLRVFNRRKVQFAPDPVNAAGNIQRFNQLRKWRRRAQPKTINHFVFAVKDFRKSFAFFRDRLGFRLTDYQTDIGIYSRFDGAFEHHNMFLADCTLPGMPGKPGFHHINFGLEDIDEVMVGANYMTRRGWQPGFLGNGRHRISSALFSYWKIPGGGEGEFGADTDYVDDGWQPRQWEFRFGTAIWMQQLVDFMFEEPAWDVKFLDDASLTGDRS